MKNALRILGIVVLLITAVSFLLSDSTRLFFPVFCVIGAFVLFMQLLGFKGGTPLKPLFDYSDLADPGNPASINNPAHPSYRFRFEKRNK